MKQYRRVFAALDGGSTQQEVAERAIQIAKLNHAELMFGHVVDSVPDSLTGTDYKELAETVRNRLVDSLGDTLKSAEEDPDIPSVEVVVKVGRIQETIHNLMIKPFEPELVICGERGLSNITYVFVGSVSTYLIRNLRCDVLVVRSAQHAPEMRRCCAGFWRYREISKPIGRRKGQPYGLFNLPALARILLADSTGEYPKAR